METCACGLRWRAPPLVTQQAITQGRNMGPTAGVMTGEGVTGEGVTEASVPGLSFSSVILKCGG